MTSARRLVSFHLTLISILSLAACSGPTTGPSQLSGVPTASLAIDTNATWHLQSIAGADGATVTVADPSVFTLMFTDGGKLAARADCNRASAGYTVAGNTLSVGPMASTRAYCASAPVDQQYLALLGGETAITVSGGTLRLSSPRGTLAFVR